MFRSLRFRMAASHAGAVLVILVILGGIGQAILEHSLNRDATAELRNAAAQQIDHFVESGRLDETPDADMSSQSAVRVGAFRPDGTPVVAPGEHLPEWFRPSSARVVDTHVRGQPVRMVTIPVRRSGRLFGFVVAARSTKPEASTLHRVRLLLLFGGFAAVLASLAAGWWLAGRAAKPVRRAYEAQANFAADASHELRTPLTYIRSAVEVMAEKDQALGGDVLEEIDYLTGLTQRLLLLARADRGALGIERRPVDLDEVCRSAARRARQAHGVRISMPERNGSLMALGDRVAAEAALDAVLENVAMHGGGVAELDWYRDGDRATVTVADRGPGMQAGEAASAFERFSRADSSRTRQSGGAGLGLPLARSLVLAQSGSIWLEASPGGGLTVKMAFPATSGAPNTQVRPLS
jgi:signal transduction histidine kinase